MVGAAWVMKELGRTRDPLLGNGGLFMDGKARVFTLGVRIIIEGAALGRVFGEGEGGKTNRVCDGVGRIEGLGGVWRKGNSTGGSTGGKMWGSV